MRRRASAVIVMAALVFSAPAVLYGFGKNKVNREVFRWNILRTVHFDVYYPRGMEGLARYAAVVVEEGYVHIANYLCHELTTVIPVVIYPSHIDFQENNVIMTILGEGVGGFTESLKTRVVVPFTGSYSEFRHVLTHELTHAFQYNILFDDTSGERASHLSMGSIPLWLMEGMAEYFSVGIDETCDMIMRDILFNNHYATLMDLTMFRIKSGYLLYKEGQSFFRFFEQTYGRYALGELFRDARDINFKQAVKIHTGKSLDELSLEWIRYYKKQYFPIIKGRKFDEEEGEQLTFHQKTQSSYNVSPAVSPDGKHLAYLTNRDIYSSISIIECDEKKKEKKKREIRTVLRGITSSKFEGMHLMSNNLTWSGDGKSICFVAQSRGRDVVFLIDPKQGDIQREIALPLRGVKDPVLSKDRNHLVFSGQDNESSDIYLYNIEKNRLRRITDDKFCDRNPDISSDNRFVIFSSNWNSGGNIEQRGYRIFKVDLASGKRSVLVDKEGSSLQGDLSADDRKLLYVSNRTGIYNIYRYDMAAGTDEMLTNVLCGTFYPRWFPDGGRMAFVAYQNLGYDIFMRNLAAVPGETDTSRATEHIEPQFPAPYIDFSDSVIDEYFPRMSADYVVFGLAGSWGSGGVFTSFAQVGVSDHMGDHRLVVTGNYIRYRGQDNTDYNAAYYYLKHRWDFGLGVFRQRNPIFGIYTLTDVFTGINSLIHNVYSDTRSIDRYGGFFLASYPFSRFFRFTATMSSSRYEWDYYRSSGRPDVYANLNQVSLALNYDNVLWGMMVPLDGMRGRFQATQSFDVTGQDFVYSSVDIDLRRYFLVGKRYIFAFRGSGGKIYGRDSEYFKYYIGGFNSLRGHPFYEYYGRNMFLGNAEFRFIFVEGIRFGFPLFFTIRGIGGVLFADFGSAWDNEYRFRDPETGEFDDFKADMGFGFRFTIYPLIILKLDYAWPYYYNRFGKRDILFSIGFEF